MTSSIDVPLQKNSITSLLSPMAISIIKEKIIIFETIDSTNVEAKRLLEEKKDSLHGTVILAEHQSAGKGRLGRAFFSPKSKGVYLSLIFNGRDISCKQRDALLITIAAAVAVRRALTLFGVDAKIKWVNDLFINYKKICGILVEGVICADKTGVSSINNYVIGIGINVTEATEGFPEELKGIAGSMNKDIDRNELIACILNSLFLVFQEHPKTLIKEYRNHSMVLNTNVTVVNPKESYSARVIAITDEAHLIVQRENGQKETLVSGEISLRL